MNHNVVHSKLLKQGHGMGQFLGTKLAGTNNTVKNSEFAWSANMCLWMGSNGRVENNKFEYIGYDGMWGAPVAPWGFDNINGLVVTKNTASKLGRGFVDSGFAFDQNQGGGDNGSTRNLTGWDISYNDVSDFSKRCHDGGAIYTWGYQNISGWNIHHNFFHDMPSFDPPGDTTDGIMAAIYFDMGSGANAGQNPTLVHHNIVWNMGAMSGVTRTWIAEEISDMYSHTYCGSCGHHPAKRAPEIYNINFTA